MRSLPIPAVAALALGIGAVASAPAQQALPSPMMAAQAENQGRIQSLDLAGRSLTVNGVTYPFHPEMQVFRQTADGIQQQNPEQINLEARVAVEQENGQVRRIHILQDRW
jgi:hypothetical protein